MAEARTYRQRMSLPHLCGYRVAVKETDLFVQSNRRLDRQVQALVIRYRGYIENYIEQHPAFATTLEPWADDGPVPGILRDMISAGHIAGVGPMASVAGALADRVGRELLSLSSEIIIENGGDVFLKANRPVTVAIDAGRSPLSYRFGITLDGVREAQCVCTSSGTIGHSFSMGRADAVVVISRSGAIADAVATAVGNRIRNRRDLQPAIDFGRDCPGVAGIVGIIGSHMGAWGEVTLTSLGKKG